MARLTARALVVAALCMVSCHAIVLEPMRGVMAGGSAPKSTAELAAAFKQDGYTIQTMHTLPTGQRGIVAESTNVTLLSTGQPKVVYYVEGTGYEMGFLHGYIAENATSVRAWCLVCVLLLLSCRTQYNLGPSLSPMCRSLRMTTLTTSSPL